MSLAYGLINSLAETETEEDLTTLVIDHFTRTINIPKGITTLGVESDDDVLRLNFKMPRYLGTVDLYNFSIRINYINAEGEDDVYKVTDKAVVGDNITFSWLVGPTAVAYKGTTKFNVCMVTTDSNSVVKQEYNTTVASLPVLEGMETSERAIYEYTDILEQWESRLFGIGDTEEAKLLAFSEEQQNNIAEKGEEVLATIPEDYQTTTKLANEGVRTKADAIICSAEGDAITVSDSSDDNLRGLKLFGKTTQVKTTGAQLASVNINVADYAYNGVTSSMTEDGNIIINGTATTRLWNRHAYADLIAGKTYILSSNSSIALSVWDVTVDQEYITKHAGIKSVTFIAPNTGRYAIVLCNEADSKLSNVRADIMLNEGDTALTWESYTGGIPAPNPEYPQELVTVDARDINATIYGKNLLDNTQLVHHPEYIDIYSTALSVLDYKVYKGKTYTLSFDTENTGVVMYVNPTCGFMYAQFTMDGKRHSFTTTMVKDVTNSTHTMALVSIAASSGVACGRISNVQIELGSEATPYEPFRTAQTVALNERDISGIPVTSGGNYTDANGQQWICDEIDFERGVYVQRVRTETITSEKINSVDNAYVSAGGSIAYFVPTYKHMQNDDVLLVMSNWCAGIPCKERNTRTNEYRCYAPASDPNVITLRYPISAGEKTLDEAKIDFGGRSLMYVLREPIETPLSADELAAFQALKSNYPSTTVLNDAGAWMNLRYNADTETWITNLIDEKIAAAVAKL